MKADILFTSDIHLSPTGDEWVVPVFARFLDRCAKEATSLYILGDLFDYWAGRRQLDDARIAPVIRAMRNLAEAGVAITLLPGNRDFLMSRSQARRLGAVMEGEVVEVEAQGLKLFLTHGDLFCTFDVRYQRMKKVLRNPAFLFLARLIPSSFALAAARRLRKHSSRVKRLKSTHETSLDKRYIQSIAQKGFDAILCGHVHAAAVEDLEGGGRLITLADWNSEGGSYARLRNGDLSLHFFSP
jgi:UDP-2,3-diacylglucosamine hydrolase